MSLKELQAENLSLLKENENLRQRTLKLQRLLLKARNKTFTEEAIDKALAEVFNDHPL